MIRISPKDLISIKHNGIYYYFLVRTKIILLGGNLTYVFHRTSDELLEPEELLNNKSSGFHTFVDFYDAKKNGLITKLSSKVKFDYPMPLYTKSKGAYIKPEDPLYIHEDGELYWHINDLEHNWCSQKLELTAEEELYPTPSTHNIISCCNLIKAKVKDGFYEHCP